MGDQSAIDSRPSFRDRPLLTGPSVATGWARVVGEAPAFEVGRNPDATSSTV
jgi:hypothetical protein